MTKNGCHLILGDLRAQNAFKKFRAAQRLYQKPNGDSGHTEHRPGQQLKYAGNLECQSPQPGPGLKDHTNQSLLPRPSLLPCWLLFPRNHSHQAKQCRQYHNLSIRFPWKKKAYHPEIFHTWDINLSVHSCLTVSKKIVEGRYMNFLSTLRDICNTETETYIMCVQKSRWVFQ